MKIIYAVKDILMIMCSTKHKKKPIKKEKKGRCSLKVTVNEFFTYFTALKSCVENNNFLTICIM